VPGLVQMKKTNTILSNKTEWKGLFEIPRLTLEDNIRLDPYKRGYDDMCCIHVARDTDH
jgi:hypothetical protein